MTLSLYDWALVAGYLGVLFYLGLRGSSMSRTTVSSFLLGGRTLTLPLFVASLVSTWYGGVLGVGEYSYRYGLLNIVVFGVPYYVFAIIFAIFFAKKVRNSNLVSIPDKLYETYDLKSGITGSILAWFISSPAPYFLMLAVLIQVVTGWPLVWSLLAGTSVVLVYVSWGGFRAVVKTDVLQFLLMFAGFILVLGFAASEYGGLTRLFGALPATHVSWTGGRSVQHVAVWFFIALWTLVAPPFHQFTYSAKNAKTARWGIVLSVMFWMVFDAITTLSGLYARVLVPDLAVPAMAYPALAEAVLPEVAKGIFYLGMLATVMSTTDAFTLISAMTLGRDIVGKVRRISSERVLNRYTQAGAVVTGIVSVGAVLLVPSIVNLWYVLGTVFIPGLLLPLLTAYYPRWRLSSRWTFRAMILGSGVSLLAFVIGVMRGSMDNPAYPFGIEPMYHGLALTVGIYMARHGRRRQENGGGR
ncbi:MAG: sodium:solute symporter family protein [Chlorobi bacterium]|nr:sodium:solute symporter family protein [Chlorobiota bacterium]